MSFLQARSGGKLHLRREDDARFTRCGHQITNSWWPATDGDICEHCAPPTKPPDLNPARDGKTHINVYSRGRTPLGRWLSNFAREPYTHPRDGRFASVEGHWYWLGVDPAEPRRDELRLLSGFGAKKLGRHLRSADWPKAPDFQNRIREALNLKCAANAVMYGRFRRSKLPLTHYYVYSDMVVNVPEAKWILDELERIRKHGWRIPS